MQKAINQGTLDNVTAIVIVLENFERRFIEKRLEQEKNRGTSRVLGQMNSQGERLNAEEQQVAKKAQLLNLHRSLLDSAFIRKEETTPQAMLTPSKRIIDFNETKLKTEIHKKPIFSIAMLEEKGEKEKTTEPLHRQNTRRVTRKTADVDLKSTYGLSHEAFRIVSKPKSMNDIQ